MDSAAEPVLHVHRLDGSVMTFAEHESGLCVYKPNFTNANVVGYSLLSTVAVQENLFSRREVKAADVARELYRKIGRPDKAEFQTILNKNLMRNRPVAAAVAKRALVIYRPDVAVLKGKTTGSVPAPRVPTFEAVPIPPPILEHHRNITVCADIFFVQGLPFFHTIMRGVGFRTAKPVNDRSKDVILQEIRAIKLYQSRGFTTRDVHADQEFECMRDKIRPVNLNLVPADGHEGEVERFIRAIKE
jgi:hypothetical protein